MLYTYQWKLISSLPSSEDPTSSRASYKVPESGCRASIFMSQDPSQGKAEGLPALLGEMAEVGSGKEVSLELQMLLHDSTSLRRDSHSAV